jgi:hypothetical protein
MDDFETRVQAIVAAALAHERKQIAAALAQQLAKLVADEHREIMRAHREELRELKLEIAKLNNQCDELRALLATDRRADASSVARRVN